MNSEIVDKFLEETGVDAEYILLEILQLLEGQSDNGQIFLVRRKTQKLLGIVRFTQDQIVIEKVKEI